ncbi:MAG TPA: deoxyhypusine synthase family protein, partial [Methanomassiliicoccaceae archaeon]|nr:deoxyhypusine synthase family protein [Methanomassiliicoccaceae archaeon]
MIDNSKRAVLEDRVQHIDLEGISTVRDLMNAYMDSSIQSRALANCARVYESALRDPERPLIVLGVSGPLIAAGLRKVIADMIRFGIVDAIVSTGAIVYQDYLNAGGHYHYKCSPNIDDLMLRELAIDRIYDTLVDEDAFYEKDAEIGEVAETLEPRGYSSREFMEVLGSRVTDEGSILYNAKKHGVPIFVPAINDSSIGIGLAGFYNKMLSEGRTFGEFMYIDSIRDNYELTQLKIASDHTAAVYIGGGVPKNFIQQMEGTADTMGHPKGGHSYAVQITADSPQWGGLSGCTFEEAQSWGKINPDAKTAVAYVEASIGLSLMVAYILQNGSWKGRSRLRPTWND